MKDLIKFAGVDSYLAEPSQQAKAAIIVIHEVWGLNDHTIDIADRLAKEGYRAVAPNLIPDLGVSQEFLNSLALDLFNPEKRNIAQPKLREFMSPLHTPEFGQETTAKLINIFAELTKQADLKVGVMGFCFGGTYSYSLAINEPRLAFAIPYYGHCDYSVEELAKITAPILAFYGEQDQALMEKLAELENKMHQAEVEFNYQVYKDCGHAFFNDTNKYAYNESAAKDSWQRALEFISQHI